MSEQTTPAGTSAPNGLVVLTPEQASALPGPAISLPSLPDMPAPDQVVEITRARIAEPPPRTAMQTARAVARDLAFGVGVESPQAVARGALSAVAETAHAADHLAEWLNNNVADLRISAPSLPSWLGNPLAGIARGTEATRDVMAERESVTGNLIEYTAQWLTGAGMAGKVASALGMPASRFTRIIRDAAAGAVAFDPRQPRLANLAEGLAPNPVSAFLAANDEDPEALARLKAGLETAGMGVVAEGVVRGLRLIRSATRRRAAPAEPATPPPEPGAPRDVLREHAGPAEVPAVDISPDLANQAEAFLRGERGATPVRINLGRIDGDEAVLDAIERIDTMLPQHIPESLANVAEAARAMGMQPGELMAGRVGGEALSARQITAARLLLRAAVNDLIRLAEAARVPAASDLDRVAFQRAFVATRAIQNAVRTGSREIGRALNAHRIMAASDGDAAKAVRELLERGGGAETVSELADRVAMLAGDPEKAAAFVAAASQTTTKDAINYTWVNVLLSNPTSAMANVLDTSMALMMNVPETWAASILGANVPAGEASARLFGLQRGLRDGFRLAGQTWRTGDSAFAGPVTRAEGAADAIANGSQTSVVADYLRMMMPVRWMAAGDELTKSMAYRSEIAGQAWRRATITEGLEGAAARTRAAELINAPPEWLDAMAQRAAIDGTFNTPLSGGAAAFQRTVDSLNVGQLPFGRVMVATFIRTPYNLLRWTAHRTPLGFLSPSIQADLVAGGAAADLAIARIAVGSAVMSTVADFVLQGRITGAGPTDIGLRQALERQGWKPYSIRVDNDYIPYGRFGTVGMLFGYAATATERLGESWMRDPRAVDMEGEPVQSSFAAAAILGLGQAVQDKTFMSGFSRLITMLADSERKGDPWLRGQLASWVPAGVAAIERSMDPEIRRADDALSAVMARIPVLSSSVAPALDLWGQPRRAEGGFWNMVSPVVITEGRPSPIDAWIVEARLPISMPPRVQGFRVGNMSASVQLDPEQHNRLIRLAGNELKLFPGPGGQRMGTHDFLNAMVEGRLPGVPWDRLSDERRALMVREAITKAREAARATMLGDDPRLQDVVTAQARASAQALTQQPPTMQ